MVGTSGNCCPSVTEIGKKPTASVEPIAEATKVTKLSIVEEVKSVPTVCGKRLSKVKPTLANWSTLIVVMFAGLIAILL